MIISLRGTNGSGKTHTVKALMRHYGAEPESVDAKGRALNYRLVLGNGTPLYLVGNYDKACGGCDGIQPYDAILPRVMALAKRGHVLFEGSLVSSGHGRIGQAIDAAFGDEVVYAFMDTPKEKCVSFVEARRAARGETKPFNPKNLLQKYRAVELSIKNIGQNLKRRVVMIDHRRAVPQLLGIIYRGTMAHTAGSGGVQHFVADDQDCEYTPHLPRHRD